MKKLLIVVLFFFQIISSGQTNPADKPLLPTPRNQTSWGNQLIITDKNGQAFKRGYGEMLGSPFYFDDWMNALVTTVIRSDTALIKIKFDLHNQDLLYLTPDNDVLIIQKDFISSFSFIDSAGAVISDFRSGLPQIDKQSDNTYYQVLADGKAQLLKFITKKIIEQKNDMTGETKKEFVSYESYYIYKNGVIKSLKKDKEFIISFLEDQRQKINEYLKDKKMNFKSLDDLSNLFKYYNSLFRGF